MASRSGEARVREPAPATSADPSSGLVTAIALCLGLCTVIGLHVFQPALSVTWSYGHLDRVPFGLGIALAICIALPLLFARIWQSEALSSPLERGLTLRRGVVWLLLAALVLALLEWLAIVWPAPWTSPDTGIFLEMVVEGRSKARWYLLLDGYAAIARALRGEIPLWQLVRMLNALAATAALMSVLASARVLAVTRRDALALAALGATAFGTLQLCVGYSDVYPVPLAITALYLWLALSACAGERHPAWALSLAALGPFVYIGLVLLLPSAAFVARVTAKRRDGFRRLAISVAAALFAAGAATIPGYGKPFAWLAFARGILDVPATSMGANPSGYQLPLDQVFELHHLNQVLHGMLLVDPVGWVLMGIAGAWAFLARRKLADRDRTALVLLASLVAPYLAYAVAMDPLYGAYGDWDLWSYGALATSLCGGLAFVLFARTHARLAGPLLGLALACSSVHLMARLHGLDADRARHLEESPAYIRVPADLPSVRAPGPSGIGP